MMKLGSIILFIWIYFVVAWFVNIYQLTQCDFEAPYKCELIHTVGLIPPVGGIVVWIDGGK